MCTEQFDFFFFSKFIRIMIIKYTMFIDRKDFNLSVSLQTKEHYSSLGPSRKTYSPIYRYKDGEYKGLSYIFIT